MPLLATEMHVSTYILKNVAFSFEMLIGYVQIPVERNSLSLLLTSYLEIFRYN